MAGIGPVEPEPPPATAPRTPTPTPPPTPTSGGAAPPTPSTLTSVGRRLRHACAAPCKPYLSPRPSRAPRRTPPSPRPRRRPPPPPDPQVTVPLYEGSGPPASQHPHTATFRFTISVRDLHPVTIRQVRAELPGLCARFIPALPLTVKGGAPRPLTLCASPYTSAPPCRPASPCRRSTSTYRTVRHSSSTATSSAAPIPRDLAASPHDTCGPRKGHSGPTPDLEPISRGSNTRLPLSQQSNAEREPPPPKRPASATPAAHSRP